MESSRSATTKRSVPDDLGKYFKGQDILERLYKDRPVCNKSRHTPDASWEMPLVAGGCLACDVLLCKKCYDAHLREDHGNCILVSLQVFLRKHRTFPCCDAMGEKIEFFCLECRVAICSSCYMTGHSDHRIVDFETGAGHMTKQINQSKDKMMITSQQVRKAKQALQDLEVRKVQRYKELRQSVRDRADRIRRWVTRAESEMIQELDNLEGEFKVSSEQDAALLTKVEKKADASHVIFTSCDWTSQSEAHLVLMNKFLSANHSWFVDQRTMPSLATESFHQRQDYFVPGSETAAVLRNFGPSDLLGEVRQCSSMKLPRFADKKFKVANAATLKNNDLVLLEKCDSTFEVAVYTSSKNKHQGALHVGNYYEKYVSFTGSGKSEITKPIGLAVCNDNIIVMETEKRILLIFSKDGIDLGVHKFKDIPRSLAANDSGLFIGFDSEIQWMVITEESDDTEKCKVKVKTVEADSKVKVKAVVADSKVKVKLFKTLLLKLELEDVDSRWRYNMAVSENGDIIINPSGKLLFGSFVTNTIREVTMMSSANQRPESRAQTYPGPSKMRNDDKLNKTAQIDAITHRQSLHCALLQTLTTSPAIDQSHVTQFCFHGNDTLLLLDAEEEQVLAVPLTDTPVKFLARTLPISPKLLDLHQAYVVLSHRDSLVRPVAMVINDDLDIVVVQKNGEIKIFHL
ncbi:uncharacterized protein LOC135498816 [Lineus longissimus]|uniref:uncharacterized protein LOC135498816 n=1 Tax=Lineus longissimus TaxID=88925 RepID=UPI00315C7F77